MAMSGTDIYHNFTSGSSSSLQTASDAVKQLADGYLEEARAIKALQDRMNSAWTGASGDAANAGANPLAQAFKDSADPLDATNTSMQTQSDVFEQSKATVVPVPPAPSKPSPWSVGLKAAIPLVGPAMAAGEENSYEQGLAKTNAANENNVRVMDQYTSMTGSTRDQIPLTYQAIPVDDSPVGLKPSSPGQITRTPRYATPVGTVAPASYQGATRTTEAAGSGSSSVPGSPGSSGFPGSAHRGASGGTNRVPTVSARSSGPGGGTTTSAYTPDPSIGQPPLGPNVTATAPGPVSGGDASFGPGEGVFGPGGGGGREVAGEIFRRGGPVAQSPGRTPGESTGTRAIAGASAVEEAVGRGANATPLGAAGRRERDEEDAEHRRLEFLIEPDPDSIFGNDRPATSPVIGE